MVAPGGRRQNARRGFTLVELLVVVAVLGILSAVAVPLLRDLTSAARGAALVVRAHGVQVAYLAVEPPSVGDLAAEAGTVPAALAGTLSARHFAGEAGVLLSVVGDGGDVWLKLQALTPGALKALAGFDRIGRLPHLQLGTSALVPLSPEAVDLMEEIEARRTQDEAAALSAGAGTSAASSDGDATSSSGAATGSGSSSSTIDAMGGARIESDANTATQHTTQETGVCSSRLSPALLKRCRAAAGLAESQ